MECEYKFKNSIIILMLIFPVFGLSALPFLIREHQMFLLIIDVLSILVMFLHGFPYLISNKMIIDNKCVKEITTYYGYSKIKELRWEEIGYIVDDYISPILFYPPYKLHIFHIMPKDGIVKKFKRISVSLGIKNYKDLLCEIVSRAGPDINIDKYILRVVEEYKNKHR